MQKTRTSGKPTVTRNLSPQPIIDSDGHVRETDEQIMEYISAGYRSRREAMLYFPLVPHHGWHRSSVRIYRLLPRTKSPAPTPSGFTLCERLHFRGFEFQVLSLELNPKPEARNLLRFNAPTKPL
jgi:hypothetical protein